MEAERQARHDRQQAATLEQTLARREAAAADRQSAIERLRNLRAQYRQFFVRSSPAPREQVWTRKKQNLTPHFTLR